ncbi:signal peptidase, endoplasmic reticulum-type [Haladaptatus litoreus]|uniref:Signal peptidase, endoplasmic reticulum-type n=1 Tax=Haladaptatus litoreus TaxID=553468 RepID=A0A1N6ZLY3_9EURY|nr:signal peptidase, endoplasmic reticulum-type [Haladaptatus litoreus]
MFRFRRLVAHTITVVLVVSLLFVAMMGVWPPAYTVISGSMAPNIEQTDVVVVMEEHRVTPPGSRSGVVSARTGRNQSYRSLGDSGDVLVFQPNGDDSAIPVLHRARFWVEKGENWYGKANPAYLAKADNCAELRNCPAPHSGFITKGDANGYYDQAVTISEPVRPGWIVGVAVTRIPGLGKVKQVTPDFAVPGFLSPKSPEHPALATQSRSKATLSSLPPPQTVASRVSAYNTPARSVSTSCNTSYVAGS